MSAWRPELPKWDLQLERPQVEKREVSSLCVASHTDDPAAITGSTAIVHVHMGLGSLALTG